MDTVKLCKTARMGDAFELLFNEPEAKLILLEQEIRDAHKDKAELLRVAKLFLPPEPQSVDHRGKRALGLIAAAAGAAGLVLGDPVKEAACLALSIFSLCTEIKALEADVRNLIRNQQALQDILTRVQIKNDRNFFLLGNEIKSTQESVAKIKEVVGTHLKTLENDILNIKGTLFTLHECYSHITRNVVIAQQIRDYIGQLDTLYTHVKSLRAAFYAYKISLFSTISSLAAGYVTEQFLLPDQLASIVRELANDEILRGTTLSPAIRVGQEAIYYEIQMVLEVSLLTTGISVVLGVPMNSESSTFNVYHATPLYQPNDDLTTASLNQLAQPFFSHFYR